MVELFYSLSGRVRVVQDRDGLFVAERVIAPDVWARISVTQYGRVKHARFAHACETALACDHADAGADHLLDGDDDTLSSPPPGFRHPV